MPPLGSLGDVRVLLTGATGLLGRHIAKTAPRGAEVLGVTRSQSVSSDMKWSRLDLLDFDKTRTLLRQERFDAVIHAAAEGNVDNVAGAQDQFTALNVGLPELLAEEAARLDSRFVHISSNAVFGGRAETYSDFDSPSPMNDYGVLKAEAERRVLNANPNAAVIRPILMYGWPSDGGRTNIALRFVQEMSKDLGVSALKDVVSQPLYAGDGARAVWAALDKGVSGPINVSGGVTLSIYEFGVLIAEVFDLDTGLVTPVDSSQLDGLSPRPQRTAFSLERLHNELDVIPLEPRAGLEIMRSDPDKDFWL